MLRSQDVSHFFQTKLKSKIDSLAQRRKVIGRRLLFAALVIAGTCLYIYLTYSPPVVVVVILGVFAWAGLDRFFMRHLTPRFKHEVMNEFFKFLMPDCTYLPKKSLSLQVLNSSMLLPAFDEFKGEDYVSGTFQGVPVEFCEIEAVRVDEVIRHNDHKEKVRTTVFDGLLFVFQLPVDLQLNLTIKSDYAIEPKNKFEKQALALIDHLTKDKFAKITVNETKLKIRQDDNSKADISLSPQVLDAIGNYFENSSVAIQLGLRGDRLYMRVATPYHNFELVKNTDIVGEEDFVRVLELLSFPSILLESLKQKKSA
jgi:hypothetical protein